MVFRGERFTKNQYIGGNCVKSGGGGGGVGQFADLRGDLLKEGGRALREGVDTQCTLCAFRTSAK